MISGEESKYSDNATRHEAPAILPYFCKLVKNIEMSLPITSDIFSRVWLMNKG